MKLVRYGASNMIVDTPHSGVIRTEQIGHLTVTEVFYEPRVRLRTISTSSA